MVNTWNFLQFYLDMKFVICFASQGRYLSRNLLRVVNEIINRAMIAFSSTGIDPNRYVRLHSSFFFSFFIPKFD